MLIYFHWHWAVTANILCSYIQIILPRKSWASYILTLTFFPCKVKERPLHLSGLKRDYVSVLVHLTFSGSVNQK